MTKEEYLDLCESTEPGTILTFSFRNMELHGKFIGCAEDAVIIEANGKGYFWPRELCIYKKTAYRSPSYS